MHRLLLFLLVVALHSCTPQENCTNAIDDDGNGRMDCFDEACHDHPACVRERCGDGVVEPEYEECDPRVAVSVTCQQLGFYAGTTGCSAECTVISTGCVGVCGDGTVQDSQEECDDGEENSDSMPDACRTDCTLPGCGDGVVDTQAGEACDDGAGNSDTVEGACRTTCQRPRCGDGILDDGEACDEGTANSDTVHDRCRKDCTLPRCGDGVVDSQAGEVCDQGEENSDTAPDTCREDCTLPGCGDGVIDPHRGETCDDGPLNSNAPDAACRPDCTDPGCGDGVVDTGEQCDQGTLNSDTVADRCRQDCTPARCGDGVTDTGEQCDEADLNGGGPNDCRVDCTLPQCGDGVVDDLYGETCDDGGNNGDAPDTPCRLDCLPQRCGDGILDTGETCDEGVLNGDLSDDPCRSDCLPRRCGDGIVDTGEECDAGVANADAPDALCRTDCRSRRCGDGIVDTLAGEGCDLGELNAEIPDAECRTDCTPKRCGDGVVDSGEECDEGAANADGVVPGCRTNCTESWVITLDNPIIAMIPHEEANRIYALTETTEIAYPTKLVIVDLETRLPQHQIYIPRSSTLHDMAISADKSRLAVAYHDPGESGVLLVDLTDPDVYDYIPLSFAGRAPSFPDNEKLLLVDRDYPYCIQDVDLSVLPATDATVLVNFTSGIGTLMDRGRNRLLAWSTSNFIRVHDATNLEILKDIRVLNAYHPAVSELVKALLSPSGRYLYYGGRQFDADTYLATGSFVPQLSALDNYSVDNMLTVDGSDLFGLSHTHLFDVVNGSNVRELPFELRLANLTHGDRRVLFVREDEPTRIYSTDIDEFIEGIPFGEPPVLLPVSEYSFSSIIRDPVRPKVYGIDFDRSQVVAMDTISGETVAVLPVRPGPFSIDVDPLGEHLFIGHRHSDSILRIDLESYEVDGEFSTSAYGNRVYTGPSGQLVVVPVYHTDSVTVRSDEDFSVLSTAAISGSTTPFLFRTEGRTHFVLPAYKVARLDGDVLTLLYSKDAQNYSTNPAFLTEDASFLFPGRSCYSVDDLATPRYWHYDRIERSALGGSMVVSREHVYATADLQYLGSLPHFTQAQTMDLDGHTLWYIADGALHSFDLNVFVPTAEPSLCGDGVLDTGEECDDGNTDNTDGCGHCMLGARSLHAASSDDGALFAVMNTTGGFLIGHSRALAWNNYGVRVSRYYDAPLGTFRAFDQDTVTGGGMSYQPYDVALLDDGSTFVADGVTSLYSVSGHLYSPLGEETASSTLVPQQTGTGGLAQSLLIASNGVDRHLVLWSYSWPSEIKGRIFGADLSPITTEKTFGELGQFPIAAQALDDGTFMVVFEGNTLDTFVVRVLSSTATVIRSFTITTEEVADPIRRQFSITGDGRVAVVYTRGGYSIPNDLLVKVYNANGGLLLGETVVSKMPQSGINYAVALFSDGRFSIFLENDDSASPPGDNVTAPYLVRRDFDGTGVQIGYDHVVVNTLTSPTSSSYSLPSWAIGRSSSDEVVVHYELLVGDAYSHHVVRFNNDLEIVPLQP